MAEIQKKCCCFSRVSTTSQDLSQQTEQLLIEAERCGYTKNDTIIIEQKESAVKLNEEERLGIQNLYDIIDKHRIECVIVYEISRLSRRPDVLYSVRDYLIKRQVNLICLKPYMRLLENDGTISQTANLLFSIFGSLAENEGYIRKARMMRGKEKSKAMGKHYTGRIPFGYAVDKQKNYIIDKSTAPLVKKVFTMYAEENVSLRTIVRELQAQGYFNGLTFHGCCRNIHEILHREYYCGTVKGMPGIISKGLYDKAQAIKKRNTITTTRVEVKALLKGIMFDKGNGHMLTANTSLGSYYSRHEGGIAVRMNIIEPIVWEYTVRTHKQFYSKDYDEAIQESTKMIQLAYRKVETLARKMEEYKQQIDRLEERVILGKISSAMADSMEESINTNLHDTKIMYQKADDDLKRYQYQQEKILDESQKQYDYEAFDLDDKIGLIKKVIDKVILSRDEQKKLYIDIYNRYNDKVEHVTLVRKWRNYVVENDKR